jgi:hypothetical protein
MNYYADLISFWFGGMVYQTLCYHKHWISALNSKLEDNADQPETSRLLLVLVSLLYIGSAIVWPYTLYKFLTDEE